MTPDGRTRHGTLTLALGGDVMTGRGVDQILARPAPPELHEPWVRDARDYVALAERAHGAIPRGAAPSYIWGDALADLDALAPDARIVNLETAVTARGTPWPGKSIHYRMHPDNADCLAAASIDCCALANNHVLDWSAEGLTDTVTALERRGIATVGAGPDRDRACAPAAIPCGAGRALVLSVAHDSSGIPPGWNATSGRAGVCAVAELSGAEARAVGDRIRRHRAPGDVAVVSIHWGENWGFAIPERQVAFARSLVDCGADVVHGHSSHHVRGVEVYQGRPILYGCGDLIDDYEGIRGFEAFRGDLGLVFMPTSDRSSGRLRALAMIPTRVRRFRIERARGADAAWLQETLARESAGFGVRVSAGAGGLLELSWDSAEGA